jgi:hypothetical protein
MEREVMSIENGKVSIPTNAEIWMTQHEIADLMQCFVAKVNANVRSILKSGILDERKACLTHTYKNGNSVEQYNLEMITALAFRIKSRNTEIFREWLMRKAISKTSSQQGLICSHWYQRSVLN